MLNVSAFILIVGILGVLYFHLRARRLFRREDAIIQKYKLFEVRDGLIRLVAEGHVVEEDFIFEYFYDAVNFLIRHTDAITLGSFVSALQQARKNGLDPAADEQLKKIELAVSSKGLPVVTVSKPFIGL